MGVLDLHGLIGLEDREVGVQDRNSILNRIKDAVQPFFTLTKLLLFMDAPAQMPFQLLDMLLELIACQLLGHEDVPLWRFF